MNSRSLFGGDFVGCSQGVCTNAKRLSFLKIASLVYVKNLYYNTHGCARTLA